MMMPSDHQNIRKILRGNSENNAYKVFCQRWSKIKVFSRRFWFSLLFTCWPGWKKVFQKVQESRRISKHLKIRFQGKGGGRTENVLTSAEEEWLSAYLDRADISRQTSGCKDNVFIWKINGEKQYAQKCYLQWTIQELLGIINGKIPVEECSTFSDSFDKDLVFRQLYDFLKKRKQY